jgi:hypothetical protein
LLPGSNGEVGHPSSRNAPIRMIPWQKVLTKALFEHDAIGMRATVIAHLGHEPTRARSPQPVGLRTVWWQQTGSCVYVPVLAGGAARGLNHHLLVRSDAPGEHDPLLDAAICGPPAGVRSKCGRSRRRTGRGRRSFTGTSSDLR